MFSSSYSYPFAPWPIFVMAGLDPAIHVPVHAPAEPAERDARIPGTSPGMSGHDEVRDRAGDVTHPNQTAARPRGRTPVSANRA